MLHKNTSSAEQSTVKVEIQILPDATDFDIPCYATEFSAGVDLRAAVEKEVLLEPSCRILIPTGIAIALPKGFEAQIRSRSGLAYKYGVIVLNSPGTIDADYRGQIKVCLANLSDQSFTIKRGDRIAQMIVAKHEKIDFKIVEKLDQTKRSDGGFGSTGER